MAELTPERFDRLSKQLKELSAPKPNRPIPSPPDYKKKVGILFRHHPAEVRVEARICLDRLMAKHGYKMAKMTPRQKRSYKGILVSTATNMAKARLGLTMSFDERRKLCRNKKRKVSMLKTQLGLQRGLMEFPGATLTDKWRARRAAAKIETEANHNYNGDPAPRLRVKEGEYA